MLARETTKFWHGTGKGALRPTHMHTPSPSNASSATGRKGWHPKTTRTMALVWLWLRTRKVPPLSLSYSRSQGDQVCKRSSSNFLDPCSVPPFTFPCVCCVLEGFYCSHHRRHPLAPFVTLFSFWVADSCARGHRKERQVSGAVPSQDLCSRVDRERVYHFVAYHQIRGMQKFGAVGQTLAFFFLVLVFVPKNSSAPVVCCVLRKILFTHSFNRPKVTKRLVVWGDKISLRTLSTCPAVLRL